MDTRKLVFKETAIVAAGEILCSVLMVVCFWAFGHFGWDVVWSALAGTGVMVVNYFFMAVTVNLAADRAAAGDPAAGQKLVRLSSTVRLLVMAVVLIAGIKLGGNVLALVLPLAFLRPILMLAEFFRKKGD